MVKQSPQKKHPRVEPLATRHVFLDTQVYHALRHNPTNRAMIILKEQIGSHRLVLHTTDITLKEVGRQIHERVLARQRELISIEKELDIWRRSASKALPARLDKFDADALSTELFQQFQMFLIGGCNASVHRALDVRARTHKVVGLGAMS